MNIIFFKKYFTLPLIEKYGIVFILIGFFMFAVVGIFFSYSIPQAIGDETVLLAATLKMIAGHSLRPDYPTNYHMPFGTYLYLPFFILLLIFLRLSGLFGSAAELVALGTLDYAKFLPMARLISALLGVASIYLVYRICRKLFKIPFISLTASFLLATNMMFLYLAHVGRVWMPQIFVILLAFYFIAELFERAEPRVRDYGIVALLTGAAFGTHFIGILVYVPLIAVHYLKNRGRRFKEIFITNKNFWLSNGIILFLLIFAYYLNPYGFLNYGNQSSFVAGHVLGGGSGIEMSKANFWEGFSFHWMILFEYGPALTVIFLLSLIPLFMRRKDLFFILNSFILGYYIIIGPLLTSIKTPHPHYITPIIPFMAIISAYGVYEFYQSRFFAKKIKIAAIATLFIFSLYPPLLWDWAILRPSTIVSATQWIHNNLPSGSRVVNLDTYIPLNESKESIRDIQKYIPVFFTKKQSYLLSMNDADYPKPNFYVLAPGFYPDGVPSEILMNHFDYLVMSWYTGGYADAVKKAAPYGVREKDLVRIFPSDAAPDSFSMDIENIRHPLSNLRKLTHNGPVIVVYKIRK